MNIVSALFVNTEDFPEWKMTATNVHLDPLPEGKVIASCTKELNNLRVPDLEDAVIEDPEPGSGRASSCIVIF